MSLMVDISVLEKYFKLPINDCTTSLSVFSHHIH